MYVVTDAPDDVCSKGIHVPPPPAPAPARTRADSEAVELDKLVVTGTRVQGRSPDVFDRSIDVHISHLRRKLRDDARKPRFIKTLRSVGYQFVGGEE